VTGCAIGGYLHDCWLDADRIRLATCTVNAVPVHSTNWPRRSPESAPDPTSNTWVPFSGTVTATGVDDDLARRPDGGSGPTSILFRLRDSPLRARVRRRRRFPAQRRCVRTRRVTRRASVTQWGVRTKLVDRRGTITGGATSSTVTYSAGAGPSLTLYATQTATEAPQKPRGACL